MSWRKVFSLWAGLCCFMANILSLAAEPVRDDGIQIVTGQFGTVHGKFNRDITVRLQELCGPAAQSCHIFCSDTSFGQTRLGRHPFCRVTYRCGVSFVRSVEAKREEPILMRCPERAEVRVDAAPVSPSSN